MIISSIPDFRLQHDEALGLLRLEWITVVGTDSLRSSATQLLELARQLSVRVLLLDMNTVPNISVADELWLGTHWMPGIVQLPLQHLVLAIDSSRVHNQLAIDALHDLVQPAIRFESHYFSDADSAMHWLADATGRLPGLKAEWEAR
ncbi:hypothetical protein BEN47_08450 [Hymenobacter lapidarius]|uniref:STAS/SEC14 domain-containing protein n=1 Tax=Hymenobacter lapidarius TaxID=1908237 RepID=A0A1G1TD28_9BACT|nr:hypothetical protein [Hymenobacter lapidarius]OGX88765.1 hypothetical protein BEN47_08450 [Hymenobacter lapidarius]